MTTLNKLLLILFLSLNGSLCYAHKCKFAIDSNDATTNEHVRNAECEIGDHDFHKFGKLAVENDGDKYYMICPFVLYSSFPFNSEQETMPKGAMISIKLNDGEMVQSKTEQDTKIICHYLSRYNIDVATRHGTEDLGSGVNNNFGVAVYKWYDNARQPPVDPEDFENIYALDWMLRFEFTLSDIALLSKHRIVHAEITTKINNFPVPVKSRQSKRIRRATYCLLH